MTPDERRGLEARFQSTLEVTANRVAQMVAGLALAGDMADAAMVLDAAMVAAADMAAAHFSQLSGSVASAGGVPERVGGSVVGDAVADFGRLVTDVDRSAQKVGDAARRHADRAVYQGHAVGAARWADEADVTVKLWLRRVSPGEVCGLCVQAASRVYTRGDLRPVHNRCRCTVRPVLPDEEIEDLLAGPVGLAGSVNREVREVGRRVGGRTSGAERRTRASNVRVDVSTP